MAQTPFCANSVCGAPIGPVLFSGAFASGYFDSQTNAWYCNAGCAEKVRGSLTINTYPYPGG
jgi:hypothetical protein